MLKGTLPELDAVSRGCAGGWEVLLRHAGDAVAALLGGLAVGYALHGICSLLLLLHGGSLMADAGWTLLGCWNLEMHVVLGCQQ